MRRRWLITGYWPTIGLLVTWSALVSLLVHMNLELAKWALAGNMIVGFTFGLAFWYLSERNQRLEGLYWWAYLFVFTLSGIPMGFIVVSMLPTVWAIPVAILGGVLGIGVLLYGWRDLRSGTSPFTGK